MNSIHQFFRDDTRLFFFCALLMLLYQIFLWKYQKFYNFSPEMAQHPLSRKYHLNRSCTAGLPKINGLYALSSIVSIALSSIILLTFGFKAALISLGILFTVLNWCTTAYCGRRYGQCDI